MTLLEKIDTDIKSAMLSKVDKNHLEGLRAIKAALLVVKTQEANVVITEEMELKLLQRLVKQRKESAEIYSTAGKQDLASTELAQANIIETYLPKQLSYDELCLEINKIVEETGASSIRDMGKVMGIASKEFAGKADGKTISDIVKSSLQK